MHYELKYNDKHGVLYVKTLTMLTGKDVHKMMPEIEYILKGKNKRLVIGDISQNPSGLLSKEARNAFKEYAKQIDFDRIAVIGANPATRMIAKITLRIMNRSDISKFFQSEEEALDWLKGA